MTLVISTRGNGVKRDNEKARHYFELAAKQGNANAKKALGSMIAVHKETEAKMDG